MSIHVGSKGEPCTALITSIGSLSPVSSLFLFAHQDTILDDHFVITLSVAAENMFLGTILWAEGRQGGKSEHSEQKMRMM